MLRVGAADCTELALQIPSYFFAMNGKASSGFSDVAVAFKRQLPDLYGFVTAAAAGLIFPSGSTAVSDGGYHHIFRARGSAISPTVGAGGMFKLTWRTSHSASNPTFQSTFEIGRDHTPSAASFVE